jgi:hypothetical protein
MNKSAIGKMVWLSFFAFFALFGTGETKAQNLVVNGDFSAGIQGWTVVPSGTPPWPLVNGGASLHPSTGGYIGTVIYQTLQITDVGGKTYLFSMKLLKNGTPSDSSRTVAVYLTYTDSVVGSVQFELANPLNSEISTPVSSEGVPVFSGTVTASARLPETATAITRIDFYKKDLGDFVVDDIVLSQGTAPCAFTVTKADKAYPAIYVRHEGETATVNLYASSPSCAWNASVTGGADWLALSGATSGTGNGSIQLVAKSNPSATGLPRGGTFTLGTGQTFAVQQLAAPLGRAVISLGPLRSQRAGQHTATLLQNGKVLVAGGHTNVNTTDVLATAELYDPATRAFAFTGSMNVPRWGHSATLLPDGKVLMAGGYNFAGGAHANLDTAELYDPSTGQFTLLASKMSSPRRQHTATAFADSTSKGMKVLIAGGIASGGAAASDVWGVTNKADLYDAATGTFAPTGNLLAGRGTHRATPVGATKILVAGGSNFTAYLTSAELYDTVTGTFSATGSLATGRAHGIGNFQTFFGGGVTTGQACLASTEMYNPATGSFTAYATLNAARRGSAVVGQSTGRVLVAGGDCTGNPTMEVIDLATDVFVHTASPMTTPRVFHTATALPGNSPESDILLIGGDPAGTAELYAYERPAGAVLTVLKAGAGTGIISGNGLLCSGDTCTGSYEAGTSVILSAVAESGSTFSGWTGGGCSGTGSCTVVMNENKAITATFLTNAETSANAGPDNVVFSAAQLDGSASQGNIVSYAWSLSHRTNPDYNRTATGAKPSLAGLMPGFYDVTLTVTDINGASKTDSCLLAAAGVWSVTGEGKQGLAEAIYLLQVMAGIR